MSSTQTPTTTGQPVPGHAPSPTTSTLVHWDERQAEAAKVLAQYFRPQLEKEAARLATLKSMASFAASRFYIPETGAPLTLMQHQAAILQYALSDNHPFIDGGTIVYSTIKKSGKTAISACVARYIAETWGTSNEVYMVANDLEQARGRAYQKLIDSIELDPTYVKKAAQSTQRTALNNPTGWKIVEKQATFEPNRSTVRAIASDYQGEAGSNPTATFWTELWAYKSEASQRLWDELTPVPTRTRGIRYVETYAGYSGESDLLLALYNLGMEGRQLTHDDIDWPFDDQPPIWVNERARLFMYWDTGLAARRMPWQTPEYYQTQATVLRPNAYSRLHENVWTDSVDTFLPIEWWNANKQPLPPIDANEPVVLGVDAAISNDCFAIDMVTRNPDPTKHHEACIRGYRLYYPLKGTPLNYVAIEDYIRELCAQYNVVQITYDQYQLHHMMTRLSQDGIAWCKVFSQAGLREVADKQLYDLIRDKHLAHNCGAEAEEHVKAAAAKTSTLGSKDVMRIIKKAADKHVDFLVAASMAVYETLRLNL